MSYEDKQMFAFMAGFFLPIVLIFVGLGFWGMSIPPCERTEPTTCVEQVE